MKKIKICFALISCFFFISSAIVPVYAATDVPTMDIHKFVDYDSDKYKYNVYYASEINGTSWHIVFLASTKPFTVISSSDGISVSCASNDFVHAYQDFNIPQDDVNKISPVVPVTDSFKKLSFPGSLNHGFVSSNFDVYDRDTGNLLFRSPLVTEITLAPLLNQTKGNLMIIVGGSLCLVVLGISLVMLSKRLHQFQ